MGVAHNGDRFASPVKPARSSTAVASHPRIPLWTAIVTYFGYGLLIALGHFRDFMAGIIQTRNRQADVAGTTDDRGLYAPIVNDFEDFYTRRLYHRISDCWNRPINTCPGAHINIITRTRDGNAYHTTSESSPCLNLGSYNYLGFGDPDSVTKHKVIDVLQHWGVSSCATRQTTGNTVVHAECDRLVAEYVGTEDALVFSMGFGTNSLVIPALCSGKETLIVSDENNHSSIAVGARSNGAVIKVFRHNNVKHLEQIIRSAIIHGQPRTRRPWKKIIIIIEGIYSMEGEMCPLPTFVALKKKYKCYLYLDEAHSIGAVGPTGRGVCEYFGVDPREVDICMGTFTKSFGSVGGYIASSKAVIDYLRRVCAASVHTNHISTPAAMQITAAMSVIMGRDGTNIGATKLNALRTNANFFRQGLIDMGAHVLGVMDSPVVPVMLYNPAKIPAFSRMCLERGIAVVVVGFPASPLLLSRTRFCLSAGHDIEELKEALNVIQDVAQQLGLLYNHTAI